MAQVRNFDGHPLLAQFHRERRDHEGRFEAPALDGLDDGGEVREYLRLEPSRRAGPGCVISDRAREVSSDGQEADVEALARLGRVAPAAGRRETLPGLEADESEHGDEGDEPQHPARHG